MSPRIKAAPHTGRNRWLDVWLIGLLAPVVCSRGLLELWVPKGVAATVQAGVILLCFGYWMFHPSKRPNRLSTYTIATASVFGFCSLLSTCLSVPTTGAARGLSTFGAMLLLTFCLAIGAGSGATLGDPKAATSVLSVTALVLVIVAVAQQANFEVLLPGRTASQEFMRPPSLTGSYLHYPLCLAVIAVQLLQAAFLYRSVWRWLCCLIAVGALLLSYGRSGYGIVFLTAVFATGLYLRKARPKPKERKWRIGATLGVVLLIVLALRYTDAVQQRALSMFDAQEGANSDRLSMWIQGSSMVVDCGPVISFCTGVVGNTGATFSHAEPLVVESGLLQQAINFGIPATVAYYLLFIGAFWACHPSHTMLRALILSCAVESLVYQSIEVIPFVVLVSFTPMLSRSMERYGAAQSPLPHAWKQIVGKPLRLARPVPNRSGQGSLAGA